MQLLSEDCISRLHPHIAITEFRRTFQNCLGFGQTDKGVEVCVKAYSTTTHYQTEKSFLAALQNHAVAIRTPTLISANDASMLLVMERLSGDTITPKNMDAHILIEFAPVLRDWHSIPLANSPVAFPIQEAVVRYRANIEIAQHLRSEEQRSAQKALARLDAEVGDIPIDTTNIVHGDLNVGNVLYDRVAKKPFALIDFERTARGDGYTDIAKFSWRVLECDPYKQKKFLEAYLARKPSEQERRKLVWFTALECLGAISYFEYRGHKEQYPFKDDALKQLETWYL